MPRPGDEITTRVVLTWLSTDFRRRNLPVSKEHATRNRGSWPSESDGFARTTKSERFKVKPTQTNAGPKENGSDQRERYVCGLLGDQLCRQHQF
jgi:hypothetical protein